mmetsp:Transcript_24827/g.65206  ORF Transcript_24827/g.65206 Transcript_24827/m.65206 type:complete len:233 (+) Transcript_24827:855-1553(+)
MRVMSVCLAPLAQSHHCQVVSGPATCAARGRARTEQRVCSALAASTVCRECATHVHRDQSPPRAPRCALRAPVAGARTIRAQPVSPAGTAVGIDANVVLQARTPRRLGVAVASCVRQIPFLVTRVLWSAPRADLWDGLLRALRRVTQTGVSSARSLPRLGLCRCGCCVPGPRRCREGSAVLGRTPRRRLSLTRRVSSCTGDPEELCSIIRTWTRFFRTRWSSMTELNLAVIG